MGQSRAILGRTKPRKVPKPSAGRKEPEHVGKVPISETDLLNGYKKIEDKIEELQRGFANKPNTRSRTKKKAPKPIRVLRGTAKDGTPGNDTIKESTNDRYQSDWKALLHFCIWIEDWESAIILHRAVSPEASPPVAALTAILFLRYMVLPQGTIVTHPETDEPYQLPHSKGPMHAIGGWTSPSTIHTYQNALSKLHQLHPTTADGAYIEECEHCKRMPLADIQRGHTCHIHTSGSRYWRTGNVTDNKLFKKNIKTYKEYAAKHYDSKSACSFLPSELRAMRDHLVAKNSLEGLMLWCIIILGVRLYLRVEEILSLTIESFQAKYFLIRDHDIHSLLVKVKGKTDMLPVLFQLWEDNTCPDFSPIRPLLLFLGLTGRKGGFIFPGLKDICAPTQHHNTPTKTC